MLKSKKLLVFLLALIFMLPSATVISAYSSETQVYGANRLFYSYALSGVGINFTVENDRDGAYLHGVALPGTYNNDGLNLNFIPPDISLSEYKYIKVSYRTDSTSSIMDSTLRRPNGESWLDSMPALNGDGKWHNVTINLDNMTGGKGILPENCTDATFRIKPFGAQTVTIENEKYFDIRYIACFKNENDANAFVYENDKYDSERTPKVDFEKASNEIIDNYMKQTDRLIDEIVYSQTYADVEGAKYYVSSSTGNDTNDGKSPETAWKTLSRANYSGLKPGDGVYLKRGDSWRIVDSFKVHDGVTYSAYSTGAKPRIICSVDGAGADKWVETEYENVYAFTEKIPADRDVGLIVFDGGDAWGIKVSKTAENKRVDNGTVFNGIKWQTIPTGTFINASGLAGDLEFYHDHESSTVYLYSESGNPGKRFNSIELGDNGHGILGDGKDNVVIDNIEVFGTGSHAIHFGRIHNLTVQYCTFKWIGGSHQFSDKTIRYGNAVECFALDNYTIHHCYASQIYDCTYTSQATMPEISKNIHVYKTVSEFSNSGLEFWNEDMSTSAGFENMQLHDNYTRYSGYGFSHQRPNKDGNFFYGAANTDLVFNNNDIYNNVNLFASKYALRVAATGYEQYNFHDNIYIMEEGKYLGYMPSNPGKGTGALIEHAYTTEAISKAVASGFESGGKFYYTNETPFENMYDLYVPIVEPTQFDDITDNFWGRNYINYVVDKGLFNGVSKSKFDPSGSMTRAMVTCVLMRMANESAGDITLPYTDLDGDAWYVDGIKWAYEKGIIDSAPKFRPDEKITREELADMLFKYADAKKSNTTLDFTDADSVTSSYKDALIYCVSNKIINGYDDGSLKPQNGATRAEVAAMIYRFATVI